MTGGALQESVEFDEPTETEEPTGVVTSAWATAHSCRAQFIYQRGNEAVDAARLTGVSIFKVRIRQGATARRITTNWRMRDARRGTVYNIREIEPITDRQAWIFLVVESGVAT